MQLGKGPHNFGYKISRMTTSWKVWRQGVDKNSSTLCPVRGLWWYCASDVEPSGYITSDNAPWSFITSDIEPSSLYYGRGWTFEFYYQRCWTVPLHYQKCWTFRLPAVKYFEFYASDVEPSSFITSDVEPSTCSYYQWQRTLGVQISFLAPEPKSGLDCQLLRLLDHTHTNPVGLLWTTDQQRPLPTKGTTNTTDEHPQLILPLLCSVKRSPVQ